MTQEFGNPNPQIASVALASQVGLLVGAALWGFSADVIGRKLAFNTSLFICAAFVLIAGGMPNYIGFSAVSVSTHISGPEAGLIQPYLQSGYILRWSGWKLHSGCHQLSRVLTRLTRLARHISGGVVGCRIYSYRPPCMGVHERLQLRS